MCATFSGVSRDTDQGGETCAQVSRESDPCGTDGDGRSRGSPAQAQASARVGRAHSSTLLAVRSMESTSCVQVFFCTRKLGYALDEQPTVRACFLEF